MEMRWGAFVLHWTGWKHMATLVCRHNAVTHTHSHTHTRPVAPAILHRLWPLDSGFESQGAEIPFSVSSELTAQCSLLSSVTSALTEDSLLYTKTNTLCDVILMCLCELAKKENLKKAAESEFSWISSDFTFWIWLHFSFLAHFTSCLTSGNTFSTYSRHRLHEWPVVHLKTNKTENGYSAQNKQP